MLCKKLGCLWAASESFSPWVRGFYCIFPLVWAFSEICAGPRGTPRENDCSKSSAWDQTSLLRYLSSTAGLGCAKWYVGLPALTESRSDPVCVRWGNLVPADDMTQVWTAGQMGFSVFLRQAHPWWRWCLKCSCAITICSLLERAQEPCPLGPEPFFCVLAGLKKKKRKINCYCCCREEQGSGGLWGSTHQCRRAQWKRTLKKKSKLYLG